MICETPSHRASSGVSFELLFNEDVYETNTGLAYAYYNDIQINEVEPAWISMYAGENQVKVEIRGNGFINTT